jgi:acetyl-CoA hydrolase
VRSRAADGAPTIVEHVDVVSTPRSDVDIVVTEHGIADLRRLTDRERGQRLARIGGT